MARYPEVGPQEARERVTAPGSRTLLVCGYDDDQKCAQVAIGGAITFNRLQAMMPLDKEREVIFYCA